MAILNNEKYLGTSLNYCFYSNIKQKIPKELLSILEIFRKNIKKIESVDNKNNGKKSDLILKILDSDLKTEKYIVESDKKHQIKIRLNNDELETKEFRIDALNIEKNIIIEIEAGRAVANYQFLKDIMECSMISNKKRVFINNELIEFNKEIYLVLAVRNIYTVNKSKHHDYRTVVRWLNTIDVSKLNLSLNGILLIGY